MCHTIRSLVAVVRNYSFDLEILFCSFLSATIMSPKSKKNNDDPDDDDDNADKVDDQKIII